MGDVESKARLPGRRAVYVAWDYSEVEKRLVSMSHRSMLWKLLNECWIPVDYADYIDWQSDDKGREQMESDLIKGMTGKQEEDFAHAIDCMDMWVKAGLVRKKHELGAISYLAQVGKGIDFLIAQMAHSRGDPSDGYGHIWYPKMMGKDLTIAFLSYHPRAAQELLMIMFDLKSTRETKIKAMRTIIMMFCGEDGQSYDCAVNALWGEEHVPAKIMPQQTKAPEQQNNGPAPEMRCIDCIGMTLMCGGLFCAALYLAFLRG